MSSIVEFAIFMTWKNQNILNIVSHFIIIWDFQIDINQQNKLRG